MINSKLTRANSTLGLIETKGFIGAVEALDVATKSASVELVSCEFVKGGIVTILITGEVGSVKAAVEAAAIAVDKLGVLRNTHVIARADEGVWDIIQRRSPSELIEDKNKLEDNLKIEKEEVKEITNIEEKSPVLTTEKMCITEEKDTLLRETIEDTVSTGEKEFQVKTEKKSDESNKDNDKEKVEESLSDSISREDLETLKVTELRSLARKLREEQRISLTKKQIKFSKKEQLIEAILKG